MRQNKESFGGAVRSVGCHSVADWLMSWGVVFGNAGICSSAHGGTPGADTVESVGSVFMEAGDIPSSYTLTAKHTVHSNLTDTAAVDTARIELEPVNAVADSGGYIVNPSGTPQDECRKFRILVEPQNKIPDSHIQWVATGGGVEFEGGISTGREVSVRATSPGEKTLTVNIKDLVGDPPQITFHGNQTTQNIPVRFMIVRDQLGNAASTEANCHAMIAEANRIFDQVGVSFHVELPILYTNRHEWFEISYGDPTEYSALTASLPRGRGMQVFMVGKIDSAGQPSFPSDVIAFNTSGGTVVSADAILNTLAHEFGHQCSWKDIYQHNAVAIDSQGQLVPPITEAAKKEWLPDDWTGGANYYPAGLLQSEVITRLLMYGRGNANRCDIPAGPVYGIWYINGASGWEYQRSLAPVGRDSIRNPVPDHW